MAHVGSGGYACSSEGRPWEPPCDCRHDHPSDLASPGELWSRRGDKGRYAGWRADGIPHPSCGRNVSPGRPGYVEEPDCPSDCLGANAHSSNAEHRPSSANRRTHRSRHAKPPGARYSTNTRTTAV